MFDLDKFKAGQLALTRDGRVAKFVAYAKEARSKKLIALVDGNILTYSDGGLFDGVPESRVLDLTAMKPRVAVLWANRYPDGSVSAYKCQQEADRAGSSAPDRIGGKALRIEIPMED